jgi:Protein of unknown function (DUF3037)
VTPFSYSILRVVPSIERGEQLNVGVVLFCRQLGFLGLRVGLDETRLRALAPELPLAEIAAHLDGFARVAQGDPRAGSVAVMPPSERFGWLAAPSSTVIQPSPVHTGLCEDPQATLDGLFQRLVAPAA